jgi:hypothetical protein
MNVCTFLSLRLKKSSLLKIKYLTSSQSAIRSMMTTNKAYSNEDVNVNYIPSDLSLLIILPQVLENNILVPSITDKQQI